MDIKALKVMVAVLENGTYSLAADKLHVSRQAVGKMLERCEKELSVTLFERRAGKLVPTEAGAPLLAEAADLVERYEDFCDVYLKPPGTKNAGTRPVQVAMVNGGNYGLPLNFIERFAKAFSQVRLEIEEMNTDAVLAAVKDRTHEVGIVGSHPEFLEGFEICTVQQMGIWLLVPDSHPYAACSYLGLSAMAGSPLVTAGRHNHLHRFVMQRCAEEGIVPDIRANATQASLMLKLAGELQAFCFGFSPHVMAPPPGFVAVKLNVRGGERFGTYALRLHSTHHASARRFWRYIQAYDAE